MSRSVADVVQVEIEFGIDAPVATVWEALCESPGEWWPNDFFVTSKPVSMKMEAWPGGRLYETGEDGEGLLWATINCVVPEQSLHFIGYIYPPFGGPCLSLVHIRLEKAKSGTQFFLTDHLIGRVGDASEESLQSGWKLVFGGGLKAWVER